jgi:hypothetical protein
MSKTTNISEDELSLLAHLHEYAKGYTAEFPFEVEAATKALGLTEEKLAKDLSYLVGHNLAGWKAFSRRTSAGHSFCLTEFWITGLGEDYMRDLEGQPGVGRRITTKVVKEGWEVIKGAAADLLKSYMTPF